jgi:hypothetical protein
LKFERHVIPASAGLDPITVMIEDHEPGRGRLYVYCWGCAWSAWWGAMGGGKGVLDFVARVDAGYLANNLISGRRQFITSRKAEEREMTYLERISHEVVLFAIRHTAVGVS